VYTLNLILHGLFAIVEEPYRLVIAVPEIDDHTYSLGVQAGGKYDKDSKPYCRGTYEVTGIQGRSKVFDPLVVVKVEKMTVNTILAHSVFVLPRPYDMYHCHFIKHGIKNAKGDVEITGNDAPKVMPSQLPLINVLTYPFADINAIRITGMPGFRAQFKPGSREFVNMHLFAANRAGHPTGAASAAFKKMMEDLMPKRKIMLTVHNSNATSTGPCSMPGLDETDLKELGPRSPLDFHVDDCISLFVDNTR
jgi:hypothetical protein